MVSVRGEIKCPLVCIVAGKQMRYLGLYLTLSLYAIPATRILVFSYKIGHMYKNRQICKQTDGILIRHEQIYINPQQSFIQHRILSVKGWY